MHVTWHLYLGAIYLVSQINCNYRCKCGHCTVQLAQNAEESLCCKEIEKCKESLRSEMVLEDTSREPSCITEHPGFTPVCLGKWSLRMAAPSFKTKDYTFYWQKGTENKYVCNSNLNYFMSSQLLHLLKNQ